MIMGKVIDKIKKYNVELFVIGILFIVMGVFTNNVMPWAEQSTLSYIESCIADMHFRHNNETKFRECVTPDLKEIESIQLINAYTAVLYSMGGVFIGLGFSKKSELKKPLNKQDSCNCGTPYRCPDHDK